MPSGVASPALRGYPQQQINDALQRDAENLKRIQRGIRASKKPGATLSVYQESRIRHFHKTLEAYMAKG